MPPRSRFAACASARRSPTSRSRCAPGEILGIAALEGQGQDELFAVLAGRAAADGRRDARGRQGVAAAASVRRDPSGRRARPRRPRCRPCCRSDRSRENIAAPRFNRLGRWGPVNVRDGAPARRERDRQRSRSTRARKRQVRRLSGGNQQKVTIARWLAAGFQTLLCFDPTRGIDVGTKRQIYALLRGLAEDGAAILLFTSELAEIPLVCDRVVCLYGGRVTDELGGGGRRRGDAADARCTGSEDGDGMTTVRMPSQRGRARPECGRLARRHGWTVGVYVLLLLLILYWRTIPAAVGHVRRSVARDRRAALRLRGDGAGGRDHLRRDRPVGRLDDEPRSTSCRRSTCSTRLRATAVLVRVDRSLLLVVGSRRARSRAGLIMVTRVADIIVTLAMLFVWGGAALAVMQISGRRRAARVHQARRSATRSRRGSRPGS